MQARRRRIVGDVVGRPIALDLVDAIQRDVEPVASFVFDDRDFDGAFANEGRLQPAIDADALLEVPDIVAHFERERIDGIPGRVATGAPDPPLAPKDLVVGEDPEAGSLAMRRDGEASLEHADRESRGRRKPALIVAQQLVEPVTLALVVAENDRRRAVTGQASQLLDVSIDGLGRRERKGDVPAPTAYPRPTQGSVPPAR